MRGALLLGLVVLAGCQAVAPLPPQASLRVLSVAPAELGATAHGREEPGLAEACRDWRLTPAQVERFFALSRRYHAGEGLQRDFYFLPCRITGQLEAEGRRWDYIINAAATARWQHADEVREFGCADSACAPLVLLMPDDGAGAD